MAVHPNLLPIPLPKQLISLPTDRLLDEFGAGGHAPGSGSAAALMGILAAQLIATVCKISKHPDGEELREFRFVLAQLEERIIPELKRLFQRDAEDFDLVIKVRVARDNETDPVRKRRLREQSLRLLHNSTDIVLLIGRRCLALVDYALIAFDGGAKKVRGDSGAAISSAIAGAMSAVFIANLNLRSFQGSRWAQQRTAEADALRAAILRKQEDAFTRITTLRPDHFDEMQPSFL